MTGLRNSLVLTLMLWLSACASIPPQPPPPVHDFATRESILEDALGQIGRPYVYGGADYDGFDCSGLTHFVYAKAGVTLPRTAAQQLKVGQRIALRYAAPGDLVFFRFNGGLHVTLYVGHEQIVQAPKTGEMVHVSKINAYWRKHYVATVRVLG